MFKLIRAKYSRLDICVTNAGHLLSTSLHIQSYGSGDNTDAWRLMLEVNLLGLTIVARESVCLTTECYYEHHHHLHYQIQMINFMVIFLILDQWLAIIYRS